MNELGQERTSQREGISWAVGAKNLARLVHGVCNRGGPLANENELPQESPVCNLSFPMAQFDRNYRFGWSWPDGLAPARHGVRESHQVYGKECVAPVRTSRTYARAHACMHVGAQVHVDSCAGARPRARGRGSLLLGTSQREVVFWEAGRTMEEQS